MRLYHVAFFYLVAGIVFCDEIFQWLGEKTGKTFRWYYLVPSQCGLLALTVLMTVWLADIGTKSIWLEPVLLACFWLAIRATIRFTGGSEG